ncbi:MAG: zinc-dependent alcohol dehydrogenase family protein [Syntrophorhabdaceae bacterium]|nr:zinc-dependent alcohol dehydrogenase family protein [Syntrophorhabdaceae bacterium]MDD4197409.1 zinc-dependent alcohol dehydrogenase family protein [Syntrophorhabdaceae bacterium]HOC45004.1 zinc-dependent alcohol dehydrogenase family protein [Syntrophorhabdaceae bacterium]
MKAMVIDRICDLTCDKEPLRLVDMPIPSPGPGEILVRVSSCGVCHTELDEIEGRTPPPKFPVVPGHQVIGLVEVCGKGSNRYTTGDRVGVAWLNSACGTCRFCREGNENLCDQFKATGRDVNGGYAEYMTVPESHAFPVPEGFSDVEAAPLLCAGTIGYRSLRLADIKDGDTIGLIGFGASAHLVIQMARNVYPSSKIFVFARSAGERDFARELGASWAGDTTDPSPEKIDRAIDTTPVWGTIVHALKNLEKGGRLVINAIRKEEIDKEELLGLSYPEHLWLEKEIKSVANVASRDIREFLDLASRIGIRPEVEIFSLDQANTALLELKERKIRGAKVIKIGQPQ